MTHLNCIKNLTVVCLLLSLGGPRWQEREDDKQLLYTRLIYTTLRGLGRLNCEDTRPHFRGFLRCPSWSVFVINLTLSFPLSQHFLRSILPCLAA